MDEKEIKDGAKPQAPEITETDKVGATIPDTERALENDKTIKVKFNKEIRDLSYEEAATLAQKGMKYDSISDDISRLKALALSGGKSLKEYINSLEENQKNNVLSEVSGIEELKENFPEIKNTEDIPESVLMAVKERGGNLLDAYLRYRLSEERQANEAKQKQQQNREISVGSQRSSNDTLNQINDEFIKGLWD